MSSDDDNEDDDGRGTDAGTFWQGSLRQIERFLRRFRQGYWLAGPDLAWAPMAHAGLLQVQWESGVEVRNPQYSPVQLLHWLKLAMHEKPTNAAPSRTLRAILHAPPVTRGGNCPINTDLSSCIRNGSKHSTRRIKCKIARQSAVHERFSA
jgi:hypothetical protein